MSKSNLCSAVIILMLTCAVTPSVHAQFTVTSEDFQASQAIVDKIADRNADQGDPEAFLVTVTPEEYMKVAKELGETLEIDKTTFFADAKGNFAIEAESPQGKMTMVYKEREQTMNQIMWAQKKVIKTSVAEMKKMRQGATDARSQMQNNMPGLEGMFEGMTDEEKAAAQRSLPGFLSGGSAKPKPTVKRTNKTRSILGHRATLHIVTMGGGGRTGIWAAKDDSELAERLRKVTEKSEAVFGMQDDDDMDEMKLLGGKVPLESVTVERGPWGGTLSVAVHRTTGMDKGNPPRKPFHVPGKSEGFRTGSMMDEMPDMGRRKH